MDKGKFKCRDGKVCIAMEPYTNRRLAKSFLFEAKNLHVRCSRLMTCKRSRTLAAVEVVSKHDAYLHSDEEHVSFMSYQPSSVYEYEFQPAQSRGFNCVKSIESQAKPYSNA